MCAAYIRCTVIPIFQVKNIKIKHEKSMSTTFIITTTCLNKKRVNFSFALCLLNTNQF